MDNMTLQQYLNLYNQPLSDDSLDAIVTLSEVAQDLKKKKDKKEKMKLVDEGGQVIKNGMKQVEVARGVA
jgi:hypothetical protein